jgi:hypothetical protein
VRLLEALNILESATIDCKHRNIDTPEVTEALDVLAPYCKPDWRVIGFRNSLRPHPGQFGPDVEGQQQILRVYFGGIHSCIRGLLATQVLALRFRCKTIGDFKSQVELEWLSAALEMMLDGGIFTRGNNSSAGNGRSLKTSICLRARQVASFT